MERGSSGSPRRGLLARALLVLVTLTSLATTTSARAQTGRDRTPTASPTLDWSRWRGPDGAGVVRAGGLPTRWSADGDHLRWRRELRGRGLSSPIVVGDRVFLTGARGAGGQRLLELPGLALAALLTLVCVNARARRTDLRVQPPVAGARRGPERTASCARAVGWTAFAAATVATLTSDEAWLATPKAFGTPAGWSTAVLAGALGVGWWATARDRSRGAAHGWRRVVPVVLAAGALAAAGQPLPARYEHFAVGGLLFAGLLACGGPPRLRGRAGRAAGDQLDDALVAFLTLVVVLLVAAAAVAPHAFWSGATQQHVWRRAAIGAGLALAAAVGWSPRRSSRRRVGALVLLAAGALCWVAVPPNELGYAASDADRAIMAAPLVTLAAWYGLGALRRAPGPPAGATSPTAALLLVATGAWLFARATVLQPGLRVQQTVLALDLATGDELWEREVFTTTGAHLDTWRTSHATPTPCSDGTLVVAHFGNGTCALDLDGRLLWAREHQDFAAATIYGAGSSPVLFEDAVIVQQDRERLQDRRPSFLAAYDKRTGAELWRVEPQDARNSYATPVLWSHDGAPELVVATWNALVSYDPRSGARLWSYPLRVQETVSSPVADGPRLFYAGGSIVGTTVALVRAADGPGATPAARDDGRLGDRHAPPDLAWSSTRATPSCVSPVVLDDLLFTLSNAGVLCCYDAADGTLHWRRRLGGGEYRASLLAGDGKVFATDEHGRTTVVAAAPVFHLLAQHDLGERVVASPAAAAGGVLLRSERALYRIE